MTSPDGTDSTEERKSADQRLLSTLGRVRRAVRRSIGVEALSSAVGVLALTLLLGALAVVVQVPVRALAVGLAALLLGGLAAVVARALIAHRRLLGSELALARWVDDHNPDFEHVSLLSAVELVRDRGHFGESARLADAAVDRATKVDVTTALEGAATQAVRHRVRRSSLFAAALVLVTAVGGLLAPQTFRAVWAALGDVNSIEAALTQVPPEPRLGDIRLTYRFPAYSERAPRTVTTPSGDIRALPGTEVQIRTTARHPVQEAELLVSHGDGDTPQRISVAAEGRNLSAKLVVSRSGTYRFKVIGTDGVLRQERGGHPIELEADDAPRVTLIFPDESPLEVNERDRLTLRFSARDDFALGEASVHWRVLNSPREGRLRLTGASAGQRRYSGEAPFDLASLALKPGDRVAYTIEMTDNDTVNGPKVGTSRTQELRIYSKRAHHAQVTALLEKSLDELVHILGDNLEGAFENFVSVERYGGLLSGVERIVRRAIDADTLLREAIQASRRDPLGRPEVAEAFDRARRDLHRVTDRKRRTVRRATRSFKRAAKVDRTMGRRVQRDQNRMVKSLEKNVVYLADLLNDQRLLDAEALARELRAQQQQLREALEEYRKAPTEEKRALLAEAIETIRNRINEITQELSKLRSSIPQDFVNREAIQPEATAEDMDAIQRMLEEGDLDQAMEAIDRMLEQTERMVSRLQEGRETLQSREYSEIQQQARQMYEDLQKLERAQSNLAGQTEKLSRKQLDRMKDRLGNAKAFIDKQVARLKQAKKRVNEARPPSFMPDIDLFERTERRLDDGIRAIEGGDFGAAREVLRKADEQIGRLQQDARRRLDQARRFGDTLGAGNVLEGSERSLRRAKPPVEEVLKDIESLMPKPGDLLSGAEQKRLEKLRKQQGELQKQAEQLEKDMKRLGEQLPIVGPQMGSMLGEAQGSMRAAEQGLGQGDAPGALGHERNALDKLRRLQQELEKMGENGSGSQSGVPLPFGTSGSGEGDRRGGDGRNPELDKVEIPQPEAYQAPAEFRQDILEAAKQGTVERYRDAVRQYYEELIK